MYCCAGPLRQVGRSGAFAPWNHGSGCRPAPPVWRRLLRAGTSCLLAPRFTHHRTVLPSAPGATPRLRSSALGPQHGCMQVSAPAGPRTDTPYCAGYTCNSDPGRASRSTGPGSGPVTAAAHHAGRALGNRMILTWSGGFQARQAARARSLRLAAGHTRIVCACGGAGPAVCCLWGARGARLNSTHDTAKLRPCAFH